MNLISQHSGILAEFNPLEPVISVPLFTFSVSGRQIIVSNHMFMVAVAVVVLLVIRTLAARSKGMVPKGLRNLIESVCVYLREEVARPILGENTDRYIGFIWTIFFFILTLNLLAMIPTEKMIFLITGKKNHFGGPATANIWITGAMAAITFFLTHLSGIRQHGLLKYLASLAPPVPWWIMPLIYFLEVLSALVKPVTLAVRLFANMIAGHILIAVILGLILIFKNYGVAAASILGDVSISFLELFFAFLQAYIFTLLSAVYIGSSITPEH
ncbi:MAG: F0F1 ATP synthase subunit A [Planctomycetota bacterium]|nr:F0F1 ATP synthase subunit A [Planctomycetota bacterium]